MASKETCVAPSTLQHPAFSIPGAPRVCPAPDIQNLTPPGCHLCIGIHVCMLTFIRFGNLGCGSKKSLPGHQTNFKKSIDQNQSFFPGLKSTLYGSTYSLS